MSTRSHLIFWSLMTLFVFALVYILNSVLLPFALGLGFAYLLNPTVNFLVREGVKRDTAALFILILFFTVMTGLLAVILPIIFREASQLSNELPEYTRKFFDKVEPLTSKIQAAIGYDRPRELTEILSENTDKSLTTAGSLLKGLFTGGMAALNIATLFIVTPFVTYFMVREWHGIKDWVKNLLPRDHKDTIIGLFREIDTKLAGFIRGQIIVAVILGLFYALALGIAGLKYGFLIGLGAGILCIIPMVGSTVGLVVAVAVAWAQSGESFYTSIIALIFLFGQVVEGNILTPKLVGDRVGLHPLWVFFALMAGGSLFGVLGMLLAVPVAAIIGVLASFAIDRYKHSAFYLESSHSSAQPFIKPPAKKRKAASKTSPKKAKS